MADKPAEATTPAPEVVATSEVVATPEVKPESVAQATPNPAVAPVVTAPKQ